MGFRSRREETIYSSEVERRQGGFPEEAALIWVLLDQ